MKQVLIAGVGAVALLLTGAQEARANHTHWTNGFESTANWWFTGNANIDVNRGLSHSGQNNGWVRNWTGWNALHIDVRTKPRTFCWVEAWIRTSGPLPNGSMVVRSNSGSNRILNETRLDWTTPAEPGHHGYVKYHFRFPSDGPSAFFYVGIWGDGTDDWAQVDDVLVHCP